MSIAFPYPVPSRLLTAIEDSRSVVLATHENPDADGLGSVIALGLALQERGREVWRLADGELAPPLDELPGVDRVGVYAEDDPAPELVVLFDCHRRERMGQAGGLVAAAPLVVAIDHHPTDPRGSDTDLSWLIEEAPSTTMMVLSMLHELHDVPLDAEKAGCLYAGLLTDTGGFRHGNTTHDALLAAADLVRAGADAEGLAERLMHRRRPQAVRLTGEALLHTRYHLDGRVALMVVDRDLLQRTGSRLEEAEGLASQLTGIEGVRFGALLKESSPSQWRISLRANGNGARVDRVARRLGGGGHRRAAAYTAEGSRESVERKLLSALGEALEGDGPQDSGDGSAGGGQG